MRIKRIALKASLQTATENAPVAVNAIPQGTLAGGRVKAYWLQFDRQSDKPATNRNELGAHTGDGH